MEYDLFMLKIAEQPKAVADALRGRIDANNIQLNETALDDAVLRDITKVIVVAGGPPAHAGMVAKYARFDNGTTPSMSNWRAVRYRSRSVG